jgi:type III pantothenate kinase
MDLIIDAGNTRIKLGYFEGGKLSGTNVFPSGSVNLLYKELQSKKIENCIYGSVIGVPGHISGYLKSKCRNFILFDKDTSLPIKVTYAKRAGSDRIALAVAANDLHKNTNLLIINAGTCITYNFVSSKAVYSGGAISLGLQMRFKALNTFTAGLPLIEVSEDIALTGRDTERSILSGVVNGLLFEIEGFINTYNKKYPGLKCILSGGDSRYILAKINQEVEHVPDLGLYGLYSILKFNNEKVN